MAKSFSFAPSNFAAIILSGMPDVDFRHIAPRHSGPRDAFEEFCCQLARQALDVPPGSTFSRYRGAGGDGGVECVWRLPDGSEWGWQAKYVFDVPSVKSQVDDSVRAAARAHPRLTRFFVCLPFDPTGPTNRKTKSGKPTANESDTLEEHRRAWERLGADNGAAFEVEIVTAAILRDELARVDWHGGRRRYWFDETVLTDAWFASHLEDVRRSSYPRYTPQLRVDTPVGHALEAFGHTEAWRTETAARVERLREQAETWRAIVEGRRNASFGSPYPASAHRIGSSAADLFESLVTRLSGELDVSACRADARRLLTALREVEQMLRETLEARHGEGMADSAGFRQFQAEYMVSFPAASLDAAREVIQVVEDVDEWLRGDEASLVGAKAMLLLGEAGVGKTHAVCDAAEQRARRGLRSVVLFAEGWRGAQAPWEHVRGALGLPPGLARDEVLGVLDAAGEASGAPLLVCVDGLNETRPRSYWRSNLVEFVGQAARFEWLKIALTCRSTYVDLVVPAGFDVLRVTHYGFRGVEFDACASYFRHYELEPPIAPVLQPEFENPLFLRLICEAMKSAGLRRLPLGWQGIHTAVQAFVGAKNAAYALEFETDSRFRYPQRGLEAFVAAARGRRQPALPWSDAARVIDGVVPSGRAPSSLMEWLVREGLLIVDAVGGEGEEEVRIAFERLGDHLFVGALLETLRPETLHAAFEPGGTLAFLVANERAAAEHAGELQALAVQLPERFGVELPDLPLPIPRARLLSVFTASLVWRDPVHLTPDTRSLIWDALDVPGRAGDVFDALLSVSTSPSALDALWFDEVMRVSAFPDRDGFWCGYLHDRFGGGVVAKLIDAAFKIDPEAVPAEVLERWAVTLLWCCAAADRRVRDHATKGLVRLTEVHPEMWARLIDRFADVDDPYVLERTLCATYGALLRSRNVRAEGLVASAVQRAIDASPVWQHALIRDHARSVLELAARDGALPAGLGTHPSFAATDWPLHVPTTEELEPLKEGRGTEKLYLSCLHDDFFIYRLGWFERYKHVLNKHAVARWIFRRTLDLGYTENRLGPYDRFLLGKFGGGRGKPEWAERLGKKLQWIARAELAARLSDHASAAPDRYAPPLRPDVTPLVFEDGRDLDPSVLIRHGNNALSGAARSSWWVARTVDFTASREQDDAAWLSRIDDLPFCLDDLRPTDDAGRPWVLLETYVRREEPHRDDERDPCRTFEYWLHSYLVELDQLDEAFRWLSERPFQPGWLPTGEAWHHGFVGEYPWAVVFNKYDPEHLRRRDLDDAGAPVLFTPTTNALTSAPNYDAFQHGALTLHVPARAFFRDALRWDGLAGYQLGDRTVFVDPSVGTAGPAALLVEEAHLLTFLERHGLAVVWGLFGEKLVAGPRIDRGKDVSHSRVFALSGRGWRASDPIYEDDHRRRPRQ